MFSFAAQICALLMVAGFAIVYSEETKCLSYFPHNKYTPKTMARKQKIHNTTGPAAPRNLNPRASSSIGPETTTWSSNTMQNAEIADNGTPTAAA